MAKKIKELTSVMIDREFENSYDKYQAELKAANVALDNGCYRQAWDHFYALHTLKDTKVFCYDFFRGEGGLGLCRVMQEIPNDDEFVKYLIETDSDLIKKAKTRHISEEYARKFIGRKYLLHAADTCGYYPAMIEYALNCVGSGHSKSFVFDYNDRDAQVGLHWADKLIAATDKAVVAMGYAVYAKYHFARCVKGKSTEDVNSFGDCVLEVRKRMKDSNEYGMYFYAHLCANPTFQSYANGKYYNPKEGYIMFCKVIEKAKDPDLVDSAQKIKKMLETKFPSKIM